VPAEVPTAKRSKDIPLFYEKLIRLVKAPIMIDTTDPEAIELALTYCQGKKHHQLDQPWKMAREVRKGVPAGACFWGGADCRHH